MAERGEVFCEYCGWTRSYAIDGLGPDSSGAACAEAREHGLTCDRHPLVQELKREKARTPEHASCRETEQKLREANRRLQQEGPALERDKLIVQLREELAKANGRIARYERHRCIPPGWYHSPEDY